MSRSQERVEPHAEGEKGKDRYHHGDLRDSLIAAAYQLVISKGAEQFTLADACRLAGVTTAAPYKHFRDKQEILEIVCERGFDEMLAAAQAAVASAGEGSLAAIQAIGLAYVSFARSKPNLFRLMFGQKPETHTAANVEQAGTGCFGYVISQVAQFSAKSGSTCDPRLVALRLWTFVHGSACLLIDEAYAKVAADLDVEQLILSTSPKLLSA